MYWLSSCQWPAGEADKVWWIGLYNLFLREKSLSSASKLFLLNTIHFDPEAQALLSCSIAWLPHAQSPLWMFPIVLWDTLKLSQAAKITSQMIPFWCASNSVFYPFIILASIFRKKNVNFRRKGRKSTVEVVRKKIFKFISRRLFCFCWQPHWLGRAPASPTVRSWTRNLSLAIYIYIGIYIYLS